MKEDPSVQAKLTVLRLAEELGNVAQACRVTGYSRDTYYRLKALYEAGGEAALRNQTRSRRLPKNQVSDEVQRRILEIAYEQPEAGQQRVADQLVAEGLKVSANGVRSVWKRHDLETRQKRLDALRAKADQGDLQITQGQMKAIQLMAQRFMDESGEPISQYPGYLLVQDTLTVEHCLDLAPLYLHVAVDSYTHFTFARYCTEKGAESSRDFLLEEVWPWLDKHGIRPQKILTDRGAEFYRPKMANAYQEALRKRGVEHLLVKAYNSTQINGLCHQFAALVETEFFPAAARKGRYKQVWQLQDELDQWLEQYNYHTPQPGRYCYGKTPAQTLECSKHLCPA